MLNNFCLLLRCGCNKRSSRLRYLLWRGGKKSRWSAAADRKGRSGQSHADNWQRSTPAGSQLATDHDTRKRPRTRCPDVRRSEHRPPFDSPDRSTGGGSIGPNDSFSCCCCCCCNLARHRHSSRTTASRPFAASLTPPGLDSVNATAFMRRLQLQFDCNFFIPSVGIFPRVFIIHAEHVVHSAWILFWLWMYVCMFVCLYVCMLVL